jgi:hypothetical protein
MNPILKNILLPYLQESSHEEYSDETNEYFESDTYIIKTKDKNIFVGRFITYEFPYGLLHDKNMTISKFLNSDVAEENGIFFSGHDEFGDEDTIEYEDFDTITSCRLLQEAI